MNKKIDFKAAIEKATDEFKKYPAWKQHAVLHYSTGTVSVSRQEVKQNTPNSQTDQQELKAK